jgi:DNA-binding transcriptional LysR family regulator
MHTSDDRAISTATAIGAVVRLYISQPTVSNEIHKLETALGADLFLRDSRQVELTTGGSGATREAPLALATLERAARADPYRRCGHRGNRAPRP